MVSILGRIFSSVGTCRPTCLYSNVYIPTCLYSNMFISQHVYIPTCLYICLCSNMSIFLHYSTNFNFYIVFYKKLLFLSILKCVILIMFGFFYWLCLHASFELDCLKRKIQSYIFEFLYLHNVKTSSKKSHNYVFMLYATFFLDIKSSNLNV